MNLQFFINAFLLGVGLAMDAFSVSMVNGLNEPKMKVSKMSLIAFTFGGFQAFMPLADYIMVHTVLEYFKVFEKFIPWIALGLLCYIGGKMLIEGIQNKESDEKVAVSMKDLLVQGIATAIDALSVGFTIASYDFFPALICCLIVGVVTYVISLAGILIGKRFGTKLSNKASILGGVILIGIGLEILISSFL